MKKKIVLLAIVVVALFLTFVPPVQAKQESFKFPIPAWFTQVIQPFQNSIKSLISKIDNHEARITELEKKIDFDLPNQWNVSFYKEQSGKDTIIMQAPQPSGLFIILPNNKPYCNWNGAFIGDDVSARAIAHLPTGDIYGAGPCRVIEFQSIENPLESGSSFEVEIYLWWQGTEKHTKQTINVPDRPFPPISSFLVNPPLPPLTNPNSGGMLITPSEPIGVGLTNPTIQPNLDWPSNYQELLRIP